MQACLLAVVVAAQLCDLSLKTVCGWCVLGQQALQMAEQVVNEMRRVGVALLTQGCVSV